MNERRLYVIVITGCWIISSLSSILTISAIFMANWRNNHLFDVLEGLEKNISETIDYSSFLLRSRRQAYTGGYTGILRSVFQAPQNSYAIAPSSLPEAPLDLKPPPFWNPLPPVSLPYFPAAHNTTCCIPGPAGPQGTNGKNGHPGEPGTAGEPGHPGKAGYLPCTQPETPCPECPQGPRGMKGPPGERGDPGGDGFLGEDGIDGRPGLPGPPGPRGPPGIRGLMGSKGIRGIIPDVAPPVPGPMGPRGLPGPVGRPGPSGYGMGVKGEKGQSGKSGKPGLPGRLGPPGPRGIRGSNGFCPTYCAIDGGVFHAQGGGAAASREPLQIVSNGNYKNEEP